MNGAVKGVLFDFGYTLFAHKSLADTIVACAAALGRPIDQQTATSIATAIDAAAMSPEELAHPRDLDAVVWRERWALLYGAADHWVDGLGAAIDVDMHDPQQWVPYAQTHTTLQALHAAGVAIGIVSNTGWDIRAAFAAHSLDAFVTSFTLSCEAGAVKPAAKIFRGACESLRLQPGDVVMVGDDPRSDAGAVMVGIRTFLVPAARPGSDNDIGSIVRLAGVG
jgi:putative hydrolase of the HAD superfamily